METPACPGCRERDAVIAQLLARVAALEEEVRQLKALLGRNASNSSVPPSANPPSAPKPVVKEKSGRKPGAQPGHPPHLKQWLPPERVTYKHLPVHGRQLCWAHLIRDFQGLVDHGGQAKHFGEELLLLADDLFLWWHRVRDGTMSRSTLRTYVDSQRPWLRELLSRGSACGCAKTESFCKGLLEVEPALWTFVRREGVEPTNNWAERALRKAVLWRKKAFGCHSVRGCQFVERILTVVQTLRLQRRSVWRYLHDTLRASRAGQAKPPLLPGEG